MLRPPLLLGSQRALTVGLPLVKLLFAYPIPTGLAKVLPSLAYRKGIMSPQESSTDLPSGLRDFAPWPFYEDDEIAAVTAVLASGKVNYWTGDEARKFEREYASAVGCPHGIALANGTLALELAIHALEIPPGAEIITTPRTFIASSSAIVARGCIPVLADVDPESGNITSETVAPYISERTRAILPVHVGGLACDMDPIMALAERHNLKVIEDCAQASGATYKGRSVGSIGHAGAFSFCQDKIITTGGEGGLLTLHDERAWKRAWEYKDHGKSWDEVYRPGDTGFRWVHASFGTNWRMTEVQAAIGRLQLRKLPDWIQRRRANMERLHAALRKLAALRIPQHSSDFGHAAYKAYVYVRPDRLRPDWNRDRVYFELRKLGIPAFFGTCTEIYREKAFAKSGYGPKDSLPVAKSLGETSLMFQVHPNLSTDSIDAMANGLIAVMNQATK